MNGRRRPIIASQQRLGVWLTAWNGPYESAFGRLQKFAWANNLNAECLARAVFGIRHLSNQYSRELLMGRWIIARRLNLPPEMTFVDGFMRRYSPRWGPLLASGKAFRFCPSCLKDGFHSIFYQVEGIIGCPIHDVPLVTQCLHCGAPAGPLALQHAWPALPFGCEHCGRSLCETDDPTRWIIDSNNVTEIRQRLDPIAAWFARLERYPVPARIKPPLAQLHATVQYGLESDESVFASVCAALVPLRLPASCRAVLKRPLCLRRVWARAPRDDGSSSARIEITGIRRAVIKSIRRYLERTYLHPRHRFCGFHARYAVRVQNFKEATIVVHDTDCCPLAGALMHWVHQHTSGAGITWSLAEPPPYRWRDPHPARTALWAHEVLAEFYSCAATALLRAAVVQEEARGLQVAYDTQRLLAEFSSLRVETRCFVAVATDAARDSGEWLLASGDSRLISALESYPCPKRSTRVKRRDIS